MAVGYRQLVALSDSTNQIDSMNANENILNLPPDYAELAFV